jgi:malonate transporter
MWMLIAKALLPIYVGLALGYFAGRRKLIDNVNVGSINGLLMQFALPLNLFVGIASTPRADILLQSRFAVVIALIWVLSFIPVLVLARRVFKLEGGAAAVQALTVSFSNVAGVGLPVLHAVYGAKAAFPVAIGIAAGAITISPLTLALLEIAKGGTEGARLSPAATFVRALGRSVRRPIVYAPALGGGIALLGWTPPMLLLRSVDPITDCTAGVGLFLTGLLLSAQPIRLNLQVVSSVLISNVLKVLLALGLAVLFGLAPQQTQQALLLAALPCGFFGLVFGANFGVRPAVAGSTLVFSSLLSAPILAFILGMSA